MAISVDVRPKLPLLLPLLCVILTLASDDTMPESHMSHIPGHEILEYEHVSQLQQRRKRKIKAYCLDTNESALSMTDEEPPVYAEDDSTFCVDRLSEGTWVKEEGGGVRVVRMGPESWIAAQILPQYHDQEATPAVKLHIF